MEEIKKTWIRPGRKGFNIDYAEIAKIYIETGEGLESLASRFGVSKWTLLARFKKLHIQKTIRRYQDDNCFFEYTPESCYWAGFIAADGWVNKRQIGIELGVIDKNHLEKFVLFLKGNNKVSQRNKVVFGKNNSFCSVHINSKQIIKDLECKFNIVANKSLIYIPPNQIPTNLVYHFIRGYIDGDGSISWKEETKTPRVSICSGSEKLIEWIKQNIRLISCSVGNPKTSKRDGSNMYIIEFNGKQTYDILDWLYKDASFYLERKYNRYLEYKLKNVIS